MANSFHRVNRSLRTDNGIRSQAGLLVALTLTGGWLTWAFQAQVTRYEISDSAQLAVILPPGKLEVIAEFQPSAALGKVRPGQPAILRLQGFPWAQYGTVSARVAKVAGEIRDGKVRVELTVSPPPRSRIPFQPGLPGSVEVEVERLSPAALILQSAGDVMDRH